MHKIHLILLLIAFIFQSIGYASPETTNFQAHISKPDGSDLESNNVTFTFKYKNQADNCTLYVETYTGINMTASGGNVNINLGTAVPTHGTTLAQIFDNRTTINGTPNAIPCVEGGTHTPLLSTEKRKLIVEFSYAGSGGTQSLTGAEIGSVPYSMYASESGNADSLGGALAVDYTKFSDFTSAGCIGGEYLSFIGGVFTCTVPGAPVSFSGTLSGDVTGTQSTTVLSRLRGVPIDVSVATPTSGDYLRYNGTAWVTMAGGGGGGGTVTNVGATAPLLSTGGATPTISMLMASAGQSGYLSSADWTTFNNKLSAVTSADITSALGYTPGAGGGTITAVNVTYPLTATGTNTRDISLAKATASVDGYLSSADWTTFNSKLSSITSVDITTAMPNLLTTGLANGWIWVGNGSGIAVARQISGDATIDNVGGLSITPGAVTNAKINDVAWTKITGVPTASVSTPGILSSSDFSLFSSGSSKWAQNISGDIYRASGLVGVGTASPSYPLHVVSTGVVGFEDGGIFGIHFNPSALTLGIGNPGNKYRYARLYADSFGLDLGGEGFVKFKPGNTEAMRILQDGKVGVGKSAPGYAVDVSGDVNVTGAFLVNGAPISGGGVGAVTATSPLIATGTNTRDISMAAASTSVHGYLTSNDFTTFNNKVSSQWATVTSGISYGSGIVTLNSLAPNPSLDVQGSSYTLGGNGDVTGDGAVMINDTIPISLYLAGTRILTAAEYARADVNGDGSVTQLDRDLIGNIVVANITVPQANHSVGKYIADSAIGVDYDGHVGIAKRGSTLTYALEVSGDVNLSLGSNFRINGTIVGSGNALTTNPLSQFAATTSAQLAGVLSDEIGVGRAVFNTSPVFSTDITSPVIIGGNTPTSTLTYRTTSAAGTTNADHIFQVGNNGATEAMRILNDGNVGIGTSGPVAPLDVRANGAANPFGNYLINVDGGTPAGSSDGPSVRMIAGEGGYGGFGPAGSGGNILLQAGSDGSGASPLQPGGNISLIAGSSPGGGIITIDSLGSGNILLAPSGGGRVGIGTATPGYALEVSGDINIAAGRNFKINGVNIGTTSGDAMTANPLSQFASTTSAQLAGVLSNEIGTGRVVFNTSPVFSTDITSPVIIGGNTTTSTLTYRTTSAAGTTSSDHVFQVGNNGATEAMRITNAGRLGIGVSNPAFKLELAGAASPADRKIGINGQQVVYLPDQSLFGGAGGSLFVGDGGSVLQGGFAFEGVDNTGIGLGSLNAVTIAGENTAIGFNSLNMTTTGSGNTATGSLALASNVTGSNNTAFGFSALRSTTGGQNLGIGYDAGSAITTGNYNVVIGSNTGSSIDTLSFHILLSDGAGNERVRVDNFGRVGIGMTPVSEALEVNGNVKATTVILSSDRGLKKNILPLQNSLDKILKLKPVHYQWRTEQFPEKKFDDRTHYGFIAQEVAAVYPDLVHGKEGGMGVDYTSLIAPLTEAIQQQQAQISGADAQCKALQRSVASLQEQVEKQNKLIEALTERLNKLEKEK